MEQRSILCLIGLLAAFAAPVYASQIVAGGFTTGQTGEDKPVSVNPALQLPLNTIPPFGCTDKTAGSFAMTAIARVCVCDGKRWNLFNSDVECVWNPDSR